MGRNRFRRLVAAALVTGLALASARVVHANPAGPDDSGPLSALWQGWLVTLILGIVIGVAIGILRSMAASARRVDLRDPPARTPESSADKPHAPR
ncbi:MAG: hypothetical protein U1E39_03865 [Planctomycetota bacterium]